MTHPVNQAAPSTKNGVKSTADHPLILRVIADKLRVDAEFLSPDLTLDEIGLDSLTSAEVVLAVEQAIGQKLDFDAEAAAFTRDTLLAEFVALIAAMAESARCRK